MLADAAQAVEGKLYILGGGWTVTGPAPAPCAIVMKFEVPWNEANRQHTWALRLQNEDGQPVQVAGPDGTQEVWITGEFEVGRPTGIVEGTPLDLPMVVGLGPLPLAPGRYEWRLSINEESAEDWGLSFTVRG